ncbi:MAG: hypothetical protein PHZ19_01760 [Candidatus Thermoplasmatota archaeon]|nr:hypothetical protein [Candidatus Thermoplasmatota archaeon]
MSEKAFDDATAYPDATPEWESPAVVEWYQDGEGNWLSRPAPWTGSRTARRDECTMLFAHELGDFLPSGPGETRITVRQTQAWREANGEDVEGDDPKQNDRQCALHLHPLTSTDLSGLPQWGPMVTLAHAGTLNLNDPASAAARPSDWTGGAGVTVNPADNDEWTVADGTAAPQVTRTLASRYPLRIGRLNDRGAAGDEAEYLADWMIMHKANLPIEVTLDDPDWWDPEAGGVQYEDIRDLDGVKYLAVTLTAPRSGTVTLRLQHDVWAHSSPYYTCWQHTFGPDGEHVSSKTAHELTWEFTVVEGAATYLLDIVENEEGVIPRVTTAIKHATSWRFTLPGNDSGDPEVWELGGFVARLDPGKGSPGQPDYRPEPAAHLEFRYKRAWDWWRNCWFGFGGVVDGCEAFSGLNYGYLSSFGYTREEVGLLYIHARQHCPESSLTDDLHYAKALIRLAAELNWQEGWTATYHTPEEAAENEDADGERYAATLYWWDLRHCHLWGDGDLVMDGALTVGQTTVLGGLPEQEIYFSVYPRGRVHGLSMSDDWERQRSTAGVTVMGSYDGGTYSILETVSTDEHGRFRSSPWLERDWQYRVSPLPDATDLANREYSWLRAVVPALPVAEAGKRVSMFRHPAGNVPATAWIDGDGYIRFAHTDSGTHTLGAISTVDTSGDFDSVDIETDGALIYVDARNKTTGALHRFTSEDHGATWTAHGAID